MKVGDYVLFVPDTRQNGETRWVQVSQVRARYAKADDHRLRSIEFEMSTGVAEHPHHRLGMVFVNFEDFQAHRAREALERAVEYALAKAGAVGKLSDDMLRDLCGELGVKKAPYSAIAPEKPGEETPSIRLRDPEYQTRVAAE
jgi:hypothetical protein